MGTVVAIMDGPGWTSRTDNIVIVDPAAEQLRWVPRDLWCDSLHNRINVAFARSGHEGVMAALAENDFAVQHSLCLARVAVERALADVDVVVPVERALSYWYPLHPQARIEDGKKVVRFDPPAERLRGERVHQWIGARYAVDRPASDFERLARQQVLVRRLLEEGYPFDRAL